MVLACVCMRGAGKDRCGMEKCFKNGYCFLNAYNFFCFVFGCYLISLLWFTFKFGTWFFLILFFFIILLGLKNWLVDFYFIINLKLIHRSFIKKSLGSDARLKILEEFENFKKCFVCFFSFKISLVFFWIFWRGLVFKNT